MTYHKADVINGVMRKKTHIKNPDKRPEITKIGKAKDLITQIPQVENKNSTSAADQFSIFTIT